LGRPHGLDGFLGLYVDDSELAGFAVGSVVVIDGRPYTVRALRRSDKGHQIAFEGVNDRTEAEALRSMDVFVVGRRQLGEDEYWPHDLIGMTVVTVDGVAVGSVTDVVLGTAQDRLVLDGGRIEVPLVVDLVPIIDVASRRIEVVSLPGLTAPPH